MPLGCLALSITLLRAIRMSLHRIARGA
jgi:hypothetical protein